MRSPLARLSCAIELGRTAESHEEAIGRIHKESKRLNSLVGQLLEVASAEGDPAGMRKERIGLGAMLASLLEDCRIEADARNVQFTFTASTESVVNGDRELYGGPWRTYFGTRFATLPKARRLMSPLRAPRTLRSSMFEITVQECRQSSCRTFSNRFSRWRIIEARQE